MRARENLNLKPVPAGHTPRWFLPQHREPVAVPELYVTGRDEVAIAREVDSLLDIFVQEHQLERLYVTYRGLAGVSALTESPFEMGRYKHSLFSFLGATEDHRLFRIVAVRGPGNGGTNGGNITRYEEVVPC